MAYRRDDIEQVRAATDLVELVGEVTKVKRSGRSVMAVCPFHQEKTASMSIDPARGLYHCFGCGKSGDLFRFVQETQGLEFSDAVELLARRSGVTLHRDPEAAKRRSRRQVLVDATQIAVEFYLERLRKAPDAAGARSYLRSRSYDSEVVSEYGLGYSPAGGDALVGHLRERRIAEDVAVAAGLAVRSRTGRVFDRFRGRIMFPVFDLRGDAVGFGARLLEGEGPKYLNSPETPIYRKSRLLYGLNWSKSAIVRDMLAVVVEGYTDVIALRRAGVEGAVATCGTALGEEHLDLLRRFSERVVLMFDADEAGTAASLRGFERSVPGELDLRVAPLPPGRDPAEVVDEGGVDRIRAAVDSSVPLLQFRIDRELERFDLSEPESAGRALRAAAAIVAVHPDPLSRDEHAAYVARRVVVDVERARSAVADAHRAAAERRSDPEPARRLGGHEKAEQELLRLMLANHPGLAGLDLSSEVLTDPAHRAAYELLAPVLAALGPGEPPDLGSLVGGEETPLARLLSALAMEERPLADPQEVTRKLKEGALDDRIQRLRREVATLDPGAEPETYTDRFQELIALERKRRELRSPA